MSFFKNIFSRDQKIQEIPELESDIPIYLKKGTTTQNNTFKIRSPSQSPDLKSESEFLSVETILQTQSQSFQELINQAYPNSSLSLALYDKNSPNTYIKLKPTSIPYKFLNKTDKKLFLIPLKKPKHLQTFLHLTFRWTMMYLPQHTTSSLNRKDILMSGELYTWFATFA